MEGSPAVEGSPVTVGSPVAVDIPVAAAACRDRPVGNLVRDILKVRKISHQMQ